MRKLKHLFDNNQKWVEGKGSAFFTKHAMGQQPKYLWIGCADSRIPANEILGLDAGELFVHRNVANLFPHTDFNCLSVLQYAVDYLKIEHVIVCGHYGCGGVACAMENAQFGLVDNWLRLIRDVYAREKEELDAIPTAEARNKRLVELNVLHQVMNVCHTTIVQNAWAKQQNLSIHGWVYDIATGYLKDLDCCISSLDQVNDSHRTLQLH
ncbi:MAG: carbonate dehydratase [Chlamydiia bacterium]|nr:carbonate dehydratase [Chlamydiia bacterium]